MATAFSYAKFNQWSLDTARNDHLPKLRELGRTPTVVFLGSALFSQMSTTGQWQSPNLWPSKAMMSRKRLTAINVERIARYQGPLHRISGAFNAGCGGDSIGNMLYRLTGTSNQAGDGAQAENEPVGLRDILSMRTGEVKLWVVYAGANNLHAAEGLRHKSILALRELLLTIFDMSSPGTLILLSGIHSRGDMDRRVVDSVNKDLLSLVISVGNHIEGIDKERAGKVLRTSTDSGDQVNQPGATELGEEDLGRHDSAASAQSANGQTHQAGKAEPWYHDDVEIAELGKNIARFDFATKTASVKPKPRIEFLPVPENMNPEKHREGPVHLNLEGYQNWMEVLFPKVREMLDRAKSLQSVARLGERGSHQHLPEFTPKTSFGTLYRPASRYKRGWNHKGSNWILVNAGTVQRLEDQLHKEGKLANEGEHKVEKVDHERINVRARPTRRFPLINENPIHAALRTAKISIDGRRIGAESSDDSDSSKLESVIDVAMYMPQHQYNGSSTSSPPRGTASSKSLPSRRSQGRRLREKFTAFFRRLGWKRGDKTQRFSLD